MALKWLRDQFKHLKIILWAVVAVFVLLVFVDWGAGRGNGGGDRSAAVRIGDRVVSEEEFLEELRRMNQRFQQLYGDRWNDLREQVDLPGQTVAFLIDRQLRIEEATAAGLVVSEEELRQRILSDPSFQGQDGGFVGPELYQRLIRSYFRMTPQQFERRYAEDLLVAKLSATLQHGVYVSDREVEARYRRQHERADFALVQLRYEPHLATTTIDQAELRTYFDSHLADYQRPEQRVIRYLVVETSRLRRLLPAADSDLEAYYQDHRQEFVEEEQAQARHILMRLAPGASPVERGEAELESEAVAKLARSGADFSDLAAKHSDDPGSRDTGGDLGWFGRGQMVKEFENAVWSAKPGDIVGPVESQFGFHVIRVEGFKPQRQRPFEEVREQVRYSYLEGRAAAEAELRAAELARRVAAERPDTEQAWQRFADEDEAVVLNLSPAFARDQAIPGTGGGTELAEQAFEAEVGKIGGPFSIPRGWMVWQLAEVRPEGTPPFEEVRAEVEQRVRRAQALAAAEARAGELAEQWRSGGDADLLASAFGGSVVTTADHQWGAGVGSLGGALLLDQAVFGAREGEVVGPVVLGDRGVVVARVERLQAIDPELLEQDREQLRLRLAVERADQLLDSLINERRRNTVVTVDNELMQRFAATS